MDRRGFSPMRHDPLPELYAEVVRRHQVTFEMAARAAVTGDLTLLEQSIQLCPFGDYMRPARQIINDAREEFAATLFPDYPTVPQRLGAKADQSQSTRQPAVGAA